MQSKPKVETVEEFLARGGQITVVPATPVEVDSTIRPTTAQGVQQLMSLDEGAHFFSEIKPKRKRKKKDSLKGVDVDKLPENIRKMLNI